MEGRAHDRGRLRGLMDGFIIMLDAIEIALQHRPVHFMFALGTVEDRRNQTWED